MYGLLLVCCKPVGGNAVCVVRGLESLASPVGYITNKIECPLLLLSRTIFSTRTSSVLEAISVVHECTATCQFVTMQVPQNMERESRYISRLEYKHDFTNLMYCLNSYCIASNLRFLCVWRKKKGSVLNPMMLQWLNPQYGIEHVPESMVEGSSRYRVLPVLTVDLCSVWTLLSCSTTRVVRRIPSVRWEWSLMIWRYSFVSVCACVIPVKYVHLNHKTPLCFIGL